MSGDSINHNGQRLVRRSRMTRKRRDPPVNDTPSQQDEADIVEEIGATPAADGSGLVADIEKVREAGAVDTESIRENRRLDNIVDKMRGNVDGVQINVEDATEKYDVVLRAWPANSITVNVTRRTGSPAQWKIVSRPKSGAELYAALQALHGPNEEATYDVRFTDAGKYRGHGSITMPDARPPQQQGQVMTHGATTPAAPAQPAQPDPVAQMKAMFEIFQMMQQRPAQPATAQPTAAPAADPMAQMKQMFELYRSMQPTTASAAQPVATPVPAAAADPVAQMKQMFEIFQSMQPPAAAAAAPAAASADPMAQMKQMFELFQSMQPQPAQSARGGHHAQAQTPTPNPMMAMMAAMMGGTPPVQPPPGTMWVPGFGFVPVDALAQAMSGGARPGSSFGRGPFGPRPGYDPTNPAAAHTPPQRPLTAAEQFRESMGFIRAAAEAYDELGTAFGRQTQETTTTTKDDDDPPVKVMDVGDYKLVVDNRTGGVRKFETGVANMGNVMKWLGEQREAIQKARAENDQKKQQQPQQLPPGYVEMTPGYRPPPGYVAVPLDQIPPQAPPPPQQQALPQPPEQMFAQPISGEPAEPPQRRTWGAPPTPGGGNG